MLFNIYLGTTLISWGTVLLYAKAFSDEVKREGYTTKTEQKSFEEKVAGLLPTIILFSLPVINVVMTTFLIFKKDQLFETIKKDMIKKGELYRIEDELSSKENDKTNNNELVSNSEKSRVNQGKYDELLLENKLKQLDKEKEELLKEKYRLTFKNEEKSGSTLHKVRGYKIK